MRRMELKSAPLGIVLTTPPLEMKVAAEDGTFAGYGAIFGGSPDSHGDVIQPGAFRDSLAAHDADGTMPAMLWAHDQSRPVGVWTSMGEDGKGLRVAGKLNLATAAGAKAHAHLKAGDVSGLSIGYTTRTGGRTRLPDGSAQLHKADLHEISLVTVPSHRRARVTEVKQLGSRADLEDLLRESGVPLAFAQKAAQAGWDALVTADAPPPDPAFLALARRLDSSILELKALRKP